MSSVKPNLAKERAQRLLYIRKELLRITRDELSQFSNISPNSLQNWEQMRNKGLTEEGAQRLVAAYKLKGLTCSVEWLMYGTGIKPYEGTFSEPSAKPQSEEELIIKELQYFKQTHSYTLDHIVNDDSMLPCLWPGDTVAGKCFEEKDIKFAVDLPCIIETTHGTRFVRILQTGDRPDLYNLVSANSNSFVKKLIENVEVVKAAPILWIRRRSYSK